MLLRPDFDQRVPAGHKRLSKRKKPLSINDRVAIVHKMLVLFEK